MFNFLIKLLKRDPAVTGLLAKDPFAIPEEHQNDDNTSAYPPAKYIRILLYRYTFYKPQKDDLVGRKEGKVNEPPYWKRQLMGRVYPQQGVATIASLQTEIRMRTQGR